MSASIFDRRARRAQALRVSATRAKHDFLHRALAENVAERLTAVRREFARVLDLGGNVAELLPSRAQTVGLGLGMGFDVVGDEDRLPFADASFDLVVSAGTLQNVGDLPGALLLARRVLVPDGLFVASLFGGATLGELRADLLAAESALTGRAAARVAPMVDAREAGALLNRAGFALPVVDIDRLAVRYDNLFAALGDLHGSGEGNILMGRVPLRRDVLADAARRFSKRAGADGRIEVAIDVITLTGWAPASSQPKPLARGSGQVSLASVLRRRSE
ncbi:class I SAM-dependent methyltransferase [Sphingosinicellaceae bacterium]|nr:class I SAM-dependent methyltransferase [Sphingosinicellaceae bacterium]